MTIKGKAYLVGAYEHPTRKAEDKSIAQLGQPRGVLGDVVNRPSECRRKTGDGRGIERA